MKRICQIAALAAVLCLLAACASAPAADTEAAESLHSASRIAGDIRVGWNLGNTLDSYGDWILQWTGGTPADFETAWGNPVTTRELLAQIHAAGFNALRVPVTWNQHIDGENRIEQAWLDRVGQVVDAVLDEGMYCIVNLHHDAGGEGWLRASDDSIRQNREKFQAVWTQIALYFADRDQHLLFEGFNEMLDGQNNWNYPGETATAAVNTWNQIFVDTVRATGGNNESRVLVVNTYAAGTNPNSLVDFVLPADSAGDRLIVGVHYYDPAAYCSGSGSQQFWRENGGQAQVDTMLANLDAHFISRGIPVLIGEFGASGQDNASDRADYAAYLVRAAGEYGIKCFWWDCGGNVETDPERGYYTGMALYDRQAGCWLFPEIVEALTGENP